MFFKKREKTDLNSLRDILNFQKETLLENGYPEMLNISPEDFHKIIESLWNSLSSKIDNIDIKTKGNIPLLLVVHQGDLQEKIRKIKGHTELNFNKIKSDGQARSSQFYIILDIEDGEKMVSKSTKDSLKKFKKEGRFALNLDESIALLTHYPNILKNHYLISAGIFYNKENEDLPLLWLLDENGNPELHYAWFDIAHGSYGAASYAIKLNN